MELLITFNALSEPHKWDVSNQETGTKIQNI